MSQNLSRLTFRCRTTSAQHGDDYQKGAAQLLLFRLHTREQQFSLAYEFEDADKFDDIVLIHDNCKEISLLQIKHGDSEGPDTGTQKKILLNNLFPTASSSASYGGDFNLCKYLVSYLIVAHNKVELEEYRRSCMLYTNKDLKIDSLIHQRTNCEMNAGEKRKLRLRLDNQSWVDIEERKSDTPFDVLNILNFPNGQKKVCNPLLVEEVNSLKDLIRQKISDMNAKSNPLESNDKHMVEFLKFIHGNKVLLYVTEEDVESWFKNCTNLSADEIGWLRWESKNILHYSRLTSRHLKLEPSEVAVANMSNCINREVIALKNAIVELFDTGSVNGKNSDILSSYSDVLSNVLECNERKEYSFKKSFCASNKNFKVVQLYNAMNCEGYDFSRKVISNFAILPRKNTREKLFAYITDQQIKDFFECFTLSVGQPNNFQTILKNDIRVWLKTWIPSDIFSSTDGIVEKAFDVLEDFFEEHNTSEQEMKRWISEMQMEKCFTRIRSKVGAMNRALSSVVGLHGMKPLREPYINRKLLYGICGPESLPSSCEPKPVLINDAEFVSGLRKEFKEQQFVLLLAEPGMGKTKLLQYVASQLQRQYPTITCMLVYFHDMISMLEKWHINSNLDDVLGVFSTVLSEEYRNMIKNAPSITGVGDFSIVLMLDAFDEIFSDYFEQVIAILDCLRSKKVQIIISSRKHVRKQLIGKFNILEIILMPFNESDQTNYLKKVWKMPDQNNFKLEEFLNKFKSKNSETFYDIPEIPLMLKMIAESHIELFSKADSSLTLNEKIDMIQLFDLFTDHSFRNTLVERYQLQTCPNKYELEVLIKGPVLNHQLLALKQLKIDLDGVWNIPANAKMYDAFIRHCEKGSEKSQFLIVNQKGVLFCHLLCAEYFVARYLCDHITTIKTIQLFDVLSRNVSIRKFVMMMINKKVQDFNILVNLCQQDWRVGFWACECNCINVIRYLEPIIRSFPQGNLGKMLLVSSRHGCYEICKLLLSRFNIQVDYLDDFKNTALHHAAFRGHAEIVSLLLGRGANKNAQNAQLWTPLHFARANHQNEVVDILERKGANSDLQTMTGKTTPQVMMEDLDEDVQFSSSLSTYSGDSLMSQYLARDTYPSKTLINLFVPSFQRDAILLILLLMNKHQYKFKLAHEIEMAGKMNDFAIIHHLAKEMIFFKTKLDLPLMFGENELFPLDDFNKQYGEFSMYKYVRSSLNIEHNFTDYPFQKKYFLVTNWNFCSFTLNQTSFVVRGPNSNWDMQQLLIFPNVRTSHYQLQPTAQTIANIQNFINRDMIALKDAIKDLFNKSTVSLILIEYGKPLNHVLERNFAKLVKFSSRFNPLSKEFSVAKLYDLLQQDSFDMQKTVSVECDFLNALSKHSKLPSYITKEEIHNFFHNFTLAAQMPSNMTIELKSELKSWMNRTISGNNLLCLQVDTAYMWLQFYFAEKKKSTQNQKDWLTDERFQWCLDMVQQKISN